MKWRGAAGGGKGGVQDGGHVILPPVQAHAGQGEATHEGGVQRGAALGEKGQQKRRAQRVRSQHLCSVILVELFYLTSKKQS